MRILFTSVPLHSHILPLVPLMQAAQRAGHQVAMATGAQALAQLEAAGISGFACGPTPASVQARFAQQHPELVRAAPLRSPSERFLTYVVHAMLGIYAPEMLSDLRPIVQRWRPDLIVSTPAELAGELAAAMSGIAFARHAFSPPKSAAAWRPVTDGIAALRARLDLPSAAATTAPYIDIWPPSLCPFDETTELAFPVRVPLRPEGILPQASALATRSAVLDGLPDRETVYITAGTTYNQTPGLLEAMIDAVRGRAMNAVVTIGHNADAARFGPADPSIRVVPYVPQEALLPHCGAVICNAGAGSVLGALAHGLPVVCVPCAADQHEIAAGVARSGAGVSCAWPASASTIADALQTISHPSFRQAAQRVQADIATLPPPTAVAQTLFATHC